MRYQQVYNTSLFTNIDSGCIYVTGLSFNGYAASPAHVGWTIPQIEMRLSTTSKGPDQLSAAFSENVGADETTVFGPGPCSLSGTIDVIILDRPFRYNPSLGHLLLDVRVLDGSGALDPFNTHPQYEAFDSPNDEVSRIYATNVTATSAEVVDSVGLLTGVEMSPIPSLKIFISNLGIATNANYVLVQWPTKPTTFLLQRSSGSGILTWQNVPASQILSNDYQQTFYFPADVQSPIGIFRLIWPGGTQ